MYTKVVFCLWTSQEALFRPIVPKGLGDKSPITSQNVLTSPTLGNAHMSQVLNARAVSRISQDVLICPT